MSFNTVLQHKIAVMAAVLVLLTVLAFGVLASGKCSATDDYGNCIEAWNSASAAGIAN